MTWEETVENQGIGYQKPRCFNGQPTNHVGVVKVHCLDSILCQIEPVTKNRLCQKTWDTFFFLIDSLDFPFKALKNVSSKQ